MTKTLYVRNAFYWSIGKRTFSDTPMHESPTKFLPCCSCDNSVVMCIICFIASQETPKSQNQYLYIQQFTLWTFCFQRYGDENTSKVMLWGNPKKFMNIRLHGRLETLMFVVSFTLDRIQINKRIRLHE